MIVWLAGALLLTTAPTDTLQLATTAFAHESYASAEALAASAALPPHRGAALYLVGLSRFREGQAESALAALDEAGQAEDPPNPGEWHYNRAACLYELGRFEEAETEYLQAAALNPALAVVSIVNAGFAALDGGARDRAVALAKRARTLASGPALDLVRDLEQHLEPEGGQPPAEGTLSEYRQGLAAYDSGRFEDADAHFRRALEQTPADGRTLIMAGATALKLGDRVRARAQLAAALALPLDPADREIARDYVATLSHGLASRPRGFELTARLGGGFDTNYLQSGVVDFGPSSASPSTSAIATAGLSGAWRTRPLPMLSTELSYAVDELAYLLPAAQDYSLQQHALTGLVELEPLHWLRVGLSGSGQLDLVGLSNLRVMQGGGGVGAWAEVDEADATTSRVFVEWARKLGSSSEFDYLTGDRTDAGVTQSLRLGPTTTEIEYRYRDEAIGTLTESVQFPMLPFGVCEGPCTEAFVIPFGYTSQTIGLSFRATVAPRLHVGVSGGVEWRTYLADSYLAVTSNNRYAADIDHRLRLDTRLYGSAFADFRVWRGLSLSLRYDLTVNQSNVDDTITTEPGNGCGPPGFVCHQFDYDDKNYVKQVLLFETVYHW